MSVHILDASAMIAYLNGERGAISVDTLLNNQGAVCYAHSVDLCEVFYDGIRRTDLRGAQQMIRDLRSVGVIERQDMSRVFWQRVGQLKARGRIAHPDCFCITLAQTLAGEVVTADHGEFDPLVPL